MSESASQSGKQLYEFGPFRVDPDRETLLRDGEPVPLTPKTFQVLLVLVRHSKEVVTKDDLMKSVWPDTFVEEANLSRNIFMLSRAFHKYANVLVIANKASLVAWYWDRGLCHAESKSL